jgi:hypothetical protein
MNETGLSGFVVSATSPEAATSTLETLAAELKQLAAAKTTPEGLRKHVRQPSHLPSYHIANCLITSLLQLSVERVSAYEGGSFATAVLPAAISGTVGPSSAAVSIMDVSVSALTQAAKALLASAPAYAVYGRTARTPSYAAVTKLLK